MNSSGHSKPTYLQVDLRLRKRLLAQKRCHFERRGIARSRFFNRYFNVRPESRMSSATMTWRPSISGAEVLQDAHDAGSLGAVAVRRDGHVVHFQRQLDLAGEVGHEDGRSAQDRHQHDAAVACGVRIVARDGTAHFADAVRDFLLGEQHFRYIVMHGCPLRCFCRQHARIGAWARNTERVPHAYLAWGLVYHCAPVKKRRYGNASPSAMIFTFCTGTGTLASCSRSGSGVRQAVHARRQAARTGMQAAPPRGRKSERRRGTGDGEGMRDAGDGRRGGHARRGGRETGRACATREAVGERAGAETREAEGGGRAADGRRTCGCTRTWNAGWSTLPGAGAEPQAGELRRFAEPGRGTLAEGAPPAGR